MDVEFGPYRLRRRERRLDGPGGRLDISGRSFDLLDVLLRHPNEPVSKAELFDAAWPGLTVEENTLQAHISNLRKLLGASIIVTIHGRGYKYAGPQPRAIAGGDAGPSSPPQATERLPLDRPPIIAVLPFANLSGDADQQYFSDGVTEDIIDRLSKYRILSVVGHRSSFASRGGEEEYRNLRQKLGADYVLTGNIRKSDNRVRIAVRLTEMRAETAIWAEHYDRPLADVFALQDEVVSVIAGTLLGRVEIDVAKQSTPAEPSRLTSYELVLKGIWHFKRVTREANATAADHFRRAIAEYPQNSEAHRWLSMCENSMWFFDFDRDSLANGLKVIERAIELDAANAGCYCARGFGQLYWGDIAAAGKSYHKAASLNPGDPHILAEFGLLHVYLSRLSTGRDQFERAFKLNPLSPVWFAAFVAVADFVEGSYEKALPAFLVVQDSAWDCMYALACLGQLGDLEQARSLIERYSHRGWDFLKGATAEPFINPEPRERLMAGLKKALQT